MISLEPVLEFYISNVCNLACRGCNRFNNYNFKGHLYWQDYSTEIEQWSKKLNPRLITIIGGEPTLNPDIETWAMNLRRLWPDTQIMIQTNGTYFKPIFVEFWKKYKVGFAVSLHDVTTADSIMAEWKKHFWDFETFLQGFIFQESAIIKKADHFVLSESDKNESFMSCNVKYDHTIFKGKLYKCPTMALIPEFGNQFDLRLTDRQRELIDSYMPLDSSCTQEQLEQFVLNKNTPIEQCELCPSKLGWLTAYGSEGYNLPLPKSSGPELPNFDPINEKNLEFYKKHLT